MSDAALWRHVPGASASLCAMLEGVDGPLLPPIRAELFGLSRFAQHGLSLGASHHMAPAGGQPRACRARLVGLMAATFVPRLKSNIRVLRLAHDFIGTQAATGYDVSPAAEWLLDNFHLIEAQLKEVHEGLPRRYYRSLPLLTDEPLAGLPRIYGVAWAFVAHTDSAFNEDLLVHFLNAYQESRPLSLRELWALPTTLRVVLIENLRRLAERVATHKAAREAANRCCDQVGHATPESLDLLLAQLTRRGVGPAFLAQMAQRLHDIGSSGDIHPASRHLAWLQRVLPQPAALMDQQRADQTADNLSVSNAVRALRAVGDADWPDVVTRTSALMQIMRTSAVFEAEDSASRDQSLHIIEQLARRSGQDESAVARRLLGLMGLPGLPAEPGSDVPAPAPAPTPTSMPTPHQALAAHWLVGAGRPELLRALGLREPLRGIWHWLAPRLALPVYLVAVVSGSIALIAWLLPAQPAGAPAATLGLSLLTLLLMAWPASEAVIAVLHRLVSESIRPRRLPRLAFLQGLPAAHRVLVVMPAMLTDVRVTESLVGQLARHHLANPERHAQFALLTDWGDAAQPACDGDAALLADAISRITALNLRYPCDIDPAQAAAATHATDAAEPPGAARFLLLHRERSHSTSEQAWIGWERKRGKLEQLVHALASGDTSAFLDLGRLSQLVAATPYVVTLDSDTQLPPGRLRELVGVAAHPANLPCLAADGRRVVSGYGILQPRVVTPLPAPDAVTPFHVLFTGRCGLDPYSAATSEVYQDVHAEGTYTGKGLLHVAALHAVLAGRLPEGLILSHDLLEGSIARCATVTDIALIEDSPFHADVAATRLHRWTRGDWQLLPILLHPHRYRLRAVNRWKMLDNLRRSLVAPMTWLLVLLAVAAPVLGPTGATPAAALLLAWAAFAAGPVLGALAGLVPHSQDLAWRHHLRQVSRDLMRVLWGGLWHLAMLQQHALASLDAVLRTLYRLLISRRHLLQWTPSAEAHASTDLRTLVHTHAGSAALAGALLLLAATQGGAMIWLAGWSALWMGAPVWTWWISRPRRRGAAAALTMHERHYLHSVARDSWRLFERCVSAHDHHLPPDNLQTDPQDMVAHRTSPTNIGLYLLSAACAHEFGWIDSAELLGRLEATLDTLDRLVRHRGHFLNWYDTEHATPLLPMYVSTVDSGNLSGHLLAVAQACLGWAAAVAPPDPDELPPGLPAADTAARLRQVASRCERLAWEPDFGFLYHRKRRLLHIGYRVGEQQLDASFYDLLASESRLTSLLAIAKGDVPVAHWAALGRPFYALGSETALRSWSGSMFEYLMPTLVLAEPHDSVLRDAGRAAIREQMAYGAARGVPWGISESAHAGRDHTLAYQYAPQGVPRLALRRTPADELVIAPYASALAAQLVPHLACLNLAALEELSARGACGFVDALDFTPSRLTTVQGGDPHCTPVATFMAHHQGMTIVALANVLRQGAAQRWGMADPRIAAVASLLHEHPPRDVSTLAAPPALATTPGTAWRGPALLREVLPGAAAVEPTHLLGNGRYHVTLRAHGGGTSCWGDIGINRQRDDVLRDALGSFFFVRGLPDPSAPSGLLERLARDLIGPPQAAAGAPARLVSLTAHPAPDPDACYRSVFHADRVSFEAEWPELLAQTTVWVSPEDDIEFRQIEWRNLGDTPLELELSSVFEVSLADPRADEAHPAFGNLFVSARWLPAQRALLFERRPRLAQEPSVHLAHFVARCEPEPLALQIQTDRQQWLGRNTRSDRPMGQLQRAAGVDARAPEASLVQDTGLDPVCVLAVTLRIPARGKARVTFASAIAAEPATVLAMIDKYRQPEHVRRASLMSATLTGIRLRALGMATESVVAMQSLTTALLMTLSRTSDVRPGVAMTQGSFSPSDRRRLWRLGISGDRPLILVSVGTLVGLGLVRALVQALRAWARAGIACDLVVVDTEPTSYLIPLHHELQALAARHDVDTAAPGTPACTAVRLVHGSDLDRADRHCLRKCARVSLVSDGRPLLHHVQEWLSLHAQERAQRQAVAVTEVAREAVRLATRSAPPAPVGHFVPGSGEFRFDVSKRLRPARPWINVLANPNFGCLLSETGAGCTWAINSRLHQLTAWSNDQVADPPGEWFLLQDRKTRRAWSVAPSAWGDDHARYHITHGQGSSRIVHHVRRDRVDLMVTATWCVDADLAIKQVRLVLANRGPATLALRLVGLVEWIMGSRRADRAGIDGQVAQDTEQTVLLASQREQADGFGATTAFLTLLPAAAGAEADGIDVNDPIDWTCDRREFFDASGRLVLPERLGRRCTSGLDPCAALSIDIDLAPGQDTERVFLIGHGDTPEAALQLARAAAAVPARHREDGVCRRWNELLGTVQVQTPDPLFDALVNRWLLYQTVSCRLWAKAAHSQAGGATGFRDQLQDAMALSWAAPELLRQQILSCAARQYGPGDVQHWWHAPHGAGVRTHFSDDLLWLAHACVHYLQRVGDAGLLDVPVPFLEGASIPDGAEDIYDTPRPGDEVASVYEHAARAIDHSLPTGAHGLPLMGSGDWNDGMNRVGHGGQGESVWLAWFLCRLVRDFAPIARQRGDELRARRWEEAAAGWRTALEDAGWDGQWYRRAYFDDGQPLGSQLNPEARIDLLAQAWSVFADVTPRAHQRMACEAMDRLLVDPVAGLIRLLDPPCASARPSPGYIQAYPPGVRENGGQYSHAAVWALMAQVDLARRHDPAPATQNSAAGPRADAAAAAVAAAAAADTAWRYFTYLSPAHRAAHPTRGPVYRAEPYAMAGDVYSQPPYVGRAGWSWYTGSAAWLHRAAVESIFGLDMDDTRFALSPRLPSHWPGAELHLRRGDLTLHFLLSRTRSNTPPARDMPDHIHTLQPGEAVSWTKLRGSHRFEMSLPG